MQGLGLLRPPRLRPLEEEGRERHATWFELFFDLVFVVAVAQLAHELEADTSARGFLRFALLFAPVWWAWVLYTFYADRFDSDDVAYRLLGMVGMLAIVAMGVAIPGAMTGERGAAGDAAFALAYLGARGVSVLLYLRASRYVPIARRLVRIHGTSFAVAAALWLPALLLPTPGRYVLWSLALAIEILVTPLVVWRTLGQVPLSLPHLPERFGLFTIIVLGESVVAVAGGLGDVGWGLRSAAVAVGAFALACCVWWLNFDFVDASVLRRHFLIRQVYVYGHFPIVVGLTAVGAGSLLAIEHATDDHLTAGARWALCGGLALYLVAIAGINLAAFDDRLRQLPRFGPIATIIAIALSLAAFGEPLPPVLLVGVLVLAFGGMVGRKIVRVPRSSVAAPDSDRAEPRRTDGISTEGSVAG